MAGSQLDLLFSLWTNALLSVVFLICYAIFKTQPLNDRVYFPRWYVNGRDKWTSGFEIVGKTEGKVARYVNLNWKSYVYSFNWILPTLRKTEEELLELVGLDSTVLVRVFLLGLKIFVPMLLWGCAVLIPVNKTDTYLAALQAEHRNLTYYAPDTLSIANVEDLSKRLWAHLFASYLFTGWTCLMLYIEYATVERMRFNFLSSQKQRPDQFTVLVRQVPKDDSQSVGLRIQNFFTENHREHYVTHQVVYDAKELTKLIKKKDKYEGKLERLSNEPSTPPPTMKVRKHWYYLQGEDCEAIPHYEKEIKRLEVEIKAERMKILSDEKHVMRAGFVSFHSRWGAAVCAQTQQCRDHTQWLTEWAPEPRDVYWNNLAIPYMMLNSRRLIVTVVVVILVIFFLIPVGTVQLLANLDVLKKYLPFLQPLTRWKYVRSFISGFLPAVVLKVFLLIIPHVLKTLTKFEGHVSYSKIEKYAGIKYHLFLIVNVFFGNVLIGSLFEQLKQYIAAPTTIPKAFGVSIPMKATFFMTYIMIDGWTSIFAELLRLWPLLWYHIKSSLFVHTAKDRVKVIPATPADYFIVLPRLCLYILLGLVYAVISPLILPFLCIFFAFGFLIYRNQVINVYEPKYESAASFWPSIHRNVIIALIIKHITLIGLFSVKRAFASTPFLLPLPIITIMFHLFCSQKFYPAFHNYPLQEAKIKDKMDPMVDVKNVLETAYLHPSIKLAPMDSDSNDDPETLKNGTAPGETLESSSRPGVLKISIDGSPLSESADKDLHAGNLQSPSPTPRSARHIYADNSGSSGSHKWVKRVHAGDSSPYYDAGSYLSSPALSRGNSNLVHLDGSSSLPSVLAREEITPESATGSPYGFSKDISGQHAAHVEEIDRKHSSSPESATLENPTEESTAVPPTAPEDSIDTAYREDTHGRRDE